MNENPLALVPELSLTTSSVIGLLVAGWLPRHRQWPVPLFAAAACVIGIVAAAVEAPGRPFLVFGTSYAIDTATSTARVIVLAATLLVVCVSLETVAGHKRESEFYVLLQLAALGAILLAGANDLLLLFAAYLLASIPLYALAAFRKDPLGLEAGLKYYLVGALLGVFTLTGITVLYGAARSTGYTTLHTAAPAAPAAALAVGLVGVLAGLSFKIGSVPSQFWIPDVTDGAAPPVAALVTTIPKIGGLIALYRLLEVALPAASMHWPLLVAVLAAASMTLGNLAAFFQTSVKRLLAYSTVSQVGYLLLAVSVATRSPLAQKSLLFYLAAYVLTNLAAFAVVCELPAARSIDDYRGLARQRPALAAALVVSLLGLLGTPPTAVFFGKLEVFTAAIDGGYTWLAVLAVVNTIASLFYYLRWIAPAFAPAPDTSDTAFATAGRWAALAAYAAAGSSILLGLVSGTLLPLLSGRLL